MKNNPDIIWLDKAESSNDEARKAIDALDNLSVVAVRCQTRGRGQGTHTWETSPGENLTFSVVLKDLDILPNEQIAISQITALAVVELLARNGIEAQIKLPNDIYVADRKICGILIENTLCAAKIKWSIIGIGINVNQTVFPSHLPNPTSIALEKLNHSHSSHQFSDSDMPISTKANIGMRPDLNTPPLDQNNGRSLDMNLDARLDLKLLLEKFHEIYSEYYYDYICDNSNFLESSGNSRRDCDSTSKTKLEALNQLFRSKLRSL